MVKNAAKLT